MDYAFVQDISINYKEDIMSSPYLVSDPDISANKPTHYSVVMDGAAEILSPAQVVTGGVRLHYDLNGISVGTHNVSLKAVLIDAKWGRLESTVVPFSFQRPVSPAQPGNIALSLT